MIEIKSEYISDGGREIVCEQWVFTQTERDHLTNILQGHEKNNIEVFIDQLERDFSLMYYCVFESNQGSKADQVIKLRDIISKLELAFKHIDKISSGQFEVLRFWKCVCQDDLMEKKYSDLNPRSKISIRPRSNAEAARQPLQKLIEDLKAAIEITKLRRGARQRADELDLAFVIAKEFGKFIEVPHPHAGPFAPIVEYCYEIITNKKGDRTRAIRQALKKLSSS